MKKLLTFIASIFAATSCTEPGPKYEVLEYNIYDVPAKSQITERILLKDSVTKDNVNQLLNSFWSLDSAKSMKYHDRPTHIFIYLYKDSLDFENGGENWIGMKSRINGKDYGIELKEEYFKN